MVRPPDKRGQLRARRIAFCCTVAAKFEVSSPHGSTTLAALLAAADERAAGQRANRGSTLRGMATASFLHMVPVRVPGAARSTRSLPFRSRGAHRQ
jgi:hypothetical protein